MGYRNKLLLLGSIVFCLAVSVFGITAKAGAGVVAENDRYILSMNEEDLSITVEDKNSHAVMESAVSYDDGKNNATWLGAMRSAVVLTLVGKNDDTKQADIINDDVTKKVTRTDNGFSAEIYFTKYKIGMTLNVELTDDGVKCVIPDSSIKEDGGEYNIGTVSIYPYMGSSYIDSKEGYMLVPDGNGALIYLDDKNGRFNSGYSSMIYGGDIGFDELQVLTLLWDKYETVTESEKILAPIYGIAHTDDKFAYLAVVEDGAMRATIEVQPNGVSIDYNRAYAKFILRKLYTQPTSNNSTSGSFHLIEEDRSHSDLGVRFILLSGDEADYSGMAKAYRKYLMDRGLLSKKEDSYRTRIDFLGTERENWLFGTSSVVMTRTEDVRDIIADLSAEAADKFLLVYRGWQKGGLYNVPISRYKADSDIGGTKELTKLINDMAEMGNILTLYNDALHINPDEQNATFNVVKQINKRKYEEKTYKEVYDKFLYVTPERSTYLLDKFTDSYLDEGVCNLCLGGITNNLFSFNYSGDSYTRFDCGEAYLKEVEAADEKLSLSMEQPFAYMWKNTDSFLSMPLYTSDYIFEDDSIPFLSMVLKGIMPVYSEYVNFEANKQEFFLKLVESGSYPSFYITKESSANLLYTNSSDIYSSEYSAYRDTIIEYSEKLSDIYEKTQNATIEKHEIKDNDVTIVSYSNGVKIYINYSSVRRKCDGLELEPMSYEVVLP